MKRYARFDPKDYLESEIIERAVFDCPEMRATRFHTVTRDRGISPVMQREEPPFLILQSKFVVEQSRVYIQPRSGYWSVHGPSCAFVLCKTSSYIAALLLSFISLVASFIYLSNIDRERILRPSMRTSL